MRTYHIKFIELTPNDFLGSGGDSYSVKEEIVSVVADTEQDAFDTAFLRCQLGSHAEPYWSDVRGRVPMDAKPIRF